MTNSKTQRTKLAYRATFFRAGNVLDVTARPVGYRNGYAGRGTCIKL